MIEFLPYSFIGSLFGVVLVEIDNVDYGLRMLFLLLLGDAAIVQHTLPFFWKSCKLTGIAVVSDVRNMYGILWR